MPIIDGEGFEEARIVEITPDFSSFLRDLDAGAIDAQELDDRFFTAPGNVVYDSERQDYLKDENGELIVENRSLTGEQEDVLMKEAQARDAIKQKKRQAASFKNTYEELIFGNSISSSESAEDFTRRLSLPLAPIIVRNDGSLNEFQYREFSEDQKNCLIACKVKVDSIKLTQKNFDDTVKFFNDIGTPGDEPISKKRLQGLLTPSKYGGALLEQGLTVANETRRVDDDQKELLLTLRDEAEEVFDFIEETNQLDELVSSIISVDIADTVELEQELFNSNQEPRPEQRAELKELVRNYSSLGTLVQEEFSRARRKGDYQSVITLMKQQEGLTLTEADLQKAQAATGRAQEVIKILRRTELQKSVADAIEKNPRDVRATFNLLRDYGLDSDADFELSEDLTTIAYKSRRIMFAAETLDEVVSFTEPVEFSETLETLSRFADSEFASDKDLARRLRKIIYVKELAEINEAALYVLADPVKSTRNFIGALQLRPSLPDLDYQAELNDVIAQVDEIDRLLKIGQTTFDVAKIADSFSNRSAQDVLTAIESLEIEDDSDLREDLLAYYKQYITNRRADDPEAYKQVFSFEIEALRKAIDRPDYEYSESADSNLAGLTFLSEQFRSVIAPLFKSLQGEVIGEEISKYFKSDERGRDPRQRFVQRIRNLEQQRDLTDIEKGYFQSVEALSLFNPYLAALANEAPAITGTYLEGYFRDKADATFEAIEDGEYFPLVQIGFGPAGLTAAGELVRTRPDLARQALFIDDGALPGGPFAIPKGPAWDLNSANSNETNGPMLPPLPAKGIKETDTVRSYGSPLRWYPGERLSSSDVRQGSINATVDYLITPDGISDSRYPNNEDMALILQLQAAMLMPRACLSTEVLSVTQGNSKTQKLLTLEHRFADGSTMIKRIVTDNLVIGSGLGRPSYGFETRNSNASRVIAFTERMQGTIFPKLSTTLQAFEALSSREADRPEPGEVLAIYGNGNSADTLIENLGGLFQGDNRAIRNVKKIYVITTGSLSQRPRYAAISDLRARNGVEGLVETIKARVGDVGFAEPVGSRISPDSKLELFDAQGRRITDADGRLLVVDNVIAATGFRSQIDTVLNRRLSDPGVLERVTLPTNQSVSVADRLVDDPRTLFVGTASRPDFSGLDKFAQLPAPAREALLRNGAENAVAIGFRSPDTQAAMRLFLDNIDGNILPPVDRITPQIQPRERLVSAGRILKPGKSEVFERKDVGAAPRVRRDIVADSSILSPLLLRSLSDVKFKNLQTGMYRYLVNFDNGSLVVTSPDTTPKNLLTLVGEACTDPFFYAYSQKALSRRRSSEAIEISIDIRNGRVNPRTSFAQPL